MGLLTHLETLSIEDSQIEKLPESLGKLLNLRELRLGGNELLNSLPPSIVRLNNLEELNLAMTPLALSPEQIKWLETLADNDCRIGYPQVL